MTPTVPVDVPLLFTWMKHPERGVSELVGSDWRFMPYSTLSRNARSVAASLRQLGVGPGDRVGVALPPGSPFLATLYGTWLNGSTLVPLAPALAFTGTGDYGEHVRRGIEAVDVSLFVVPDDDGAHPALDSGVATVEIGSLLLREPMAMSTTPFALAEELVLQMTSGTTGPPKAVCVTRSSLESQVRAMTSWLQWDEGDIGSSWLPMHHDMGLVSVIASGSVGSSAMLMQPVDFIRRPLSWLRCHGEFGACVSPTPAFGLEHVVRRVRPKHLDGLDFSSWRAIIVGAERIDPLTLTRFFALLQPFGLSADALRPAYGMAETTLAAAAVPLNTPLTVRRPGRDHATIQLFPDGEPTTVDLAGAVVSCGTPVGGMAVRVTGEGDVELPDGEIGELVVSGSSLAFGYVSEASRTRRPFDTEFRTGDMGFRAEGNIYVLGRLGDSLSLHGQIVHAEDVEMELGEVLGLPRRRHCVLLAQADGPPTAVVLSDRALPVGEVRGVVRRMTGATTDVHVLRVRGRTMLRTTSGKPRRRAMWEAFASGQLALEPVDLDPAMGAEA